MRIVVFFLFLAFLVGIGGVYWASYAYFRGEEMGRAEARLSLYHSTVEAELERFSHLPYVLARDPFVIETAEGGSTDYLNSRLAGIAGRAGIDAIFLIDPNGDTIAASNAGQLGSFLGQNYAFRPYFQDAMAGKQGAFYGIGATTGIPGYFYAEGVANEGDELLAAIAIKIDLSRLQESWQRAGERVILANADGVTLLASVPEWRYRTLNALTAEQRRDIVAARQFGTEGLAPLDWSVAGKGSAVIDGVPLLHLAAAGLPNNFTLHYFTTDDAARTNAWLVTGAMVLLAGLLFIWYQIMRAERIGTALKRSEDEEAALRAANARLAVEIEERRTAERQLQKTQAELERAGRLAALGQLASSVTHELGQPIAAMRNHLAAAELRADQAGTTSKLQALVERMEGITRQLKFFSRKGRDKFEEVDLNDAMANALELLQPDFQLAKLELRWARSADPVILHANRLRIEQVMTNLLKNALDALEGETEPWIEIEVAANDRAVWFQIADNGHGLGEKNFDDLREPFATTRESGQGMGLGLTISAGIVDDHSGEMTATTRSGGGAVFRAQFQKGAV